MKSAREFAQELLKTARSGDVAARVALIESRDREIGLRAQIAELQTLRFDLNHSSQLSSKGAALLDDRIAELRKELGDV